MSERRPHTEAEVVEFIRAIDVRAPESLHDSVQTMIASHAPRRSPASRGLAALAGAVHISPRIATAAGALAVVALVLALTLSGGARSGPSLREAAALTLMPASSVAPHESVSHQAELAAAVDGVAFPYWQDRLGWRSTGTRTDRIGGREVTTVFYANRAGSQVGYAIVGGLPAPSVSGGRRWSRGGVSYMVQRVAGAPVVTWLRHGHLCVVSGRGVNAATLVGLVSWHGSVSA
jgi:hypothetical protein